VRARLRIGNGYDAWEHLSFIVRFLNFNRRRYVDFAYSLAKFSEFLCSPSLASRGTRLQSSENFNVVFKLWPLFLQFLWLCEELFPPTPSGSDDGPWPTVQRYHTNAKDWKELYKKFGGLFVRRYHDARKFRVSHSFKLGFSAAEQPEPECFEKLDGVSHGRESAPLSVIVNAMLRMLWIGRSRLSMPISAVTSKPPRRA
jgi:hypothetical protein